MLLSCAYRIVQKRGLQCHKFAPYLPTKLRAYPTQIHPHFALKASQGVVLLCKCNYFRDGRWVKMRNRFPREKIFFIYVLLIYNKITTEAGFVSIWNIFVPMYSGALFALLLFKTYNDICLSICSIIHYLPLNR